MKRGIDVCPNCSAIWGVDEVQFGECDRCNYPNHTYDIEDEYYDRIAGGSSELSAKFREELKKEFDEHERM